MLDADPRDYPAVFRLRFPNVRFNAVICVDNQALDFAVANRAEFFRGVPIVFCGIDRYDPDLLRGERDITGVTDELDFTGTFALMRLLHPDAKHLLIFANSTIRAEYAAYERLAAIARQEFRQEMALEFWEDPELPDIRARASSIPADAIVFTLAYFSDSEGRPYPARRGHPGGIRGDPAADVFLLGVRVRQRHRGRLDHPGSPGGRGGGRPGTARPAGGGRGRPAGRAAGAPRASCSTGTSCAAPASPCTSCRGTRRS